MTCKWIDCRDFPDETGCTLYLSGEQEHVIQAAAQHAISLHGAENTAELREWLRNNLKEEEAALAHAETENDATDRAKRIRSWRHERRTKLPS
jgi:hypothetical protein